MTITPGALMLTLNWYEKPYILPKATSIQ